jgi:SAM-dependent methyltransferase
VTSSMPTGHAPTSREFFEGLYLADPDPWGFTDDPYERGRYDQILEHVPAGHYDTAFEPGCSIGVLTRRLADRCRRVLALDIAGPAVDEARRRCAGHPGVEIARGELPDDLPTAPLDLVVLSEIGYYFTEPVLGDLAQRIRDLLTPDGRVVAVHWVGDSPDHVLHGRDVHRVLGTRLALSHRVGIEHRDRPTPQHGRGRTDQASRGFLLDVWDVPR